MDLALALPAEVAEGGASGVTGEARKPVHVRDEGGPATLMCAARDVLFLGPDVARDVDVPPCQGPRLSRGAHRLLAFLARPEFGRSGGRKEGDTAGGQAVTSCPTHLLDLLQELIGGRDMHDDTDRREIDARAQGRRGDDDGDEPFQPLIQPHSLRRRQSLLVCLGDAGLEIVVVRDREGIRLGPTFVEARGVPGGVAGGAHVYSHASVIGDIA
jgi:hypothetical protein